MFFVVRDVYRPVLNTAALEPIRTHARVFFADTVSLDVDEPAVRLLKATELHDMRRQPAASLMDVVRGIRRSLPESAEETIRVATRGVTYAAWDTRMPGQVKRASHLIIKTEVDATLVDETSKSLTALSRFGVRRHGHMLHNAVIGSADLRFLAGEEKVKLRHVLSDVAPTELELGTVTIELLESGPNGRTITV